MTGRKKKPKVRIPLPRKTEKTHGDKTKYRRKKKHKEKIDSTDDAAGN